MFTPYQYCVGGKIEKSEVGGACGAYGGGERCPQGSSGETGWSWLRIGKGGRHL